MWLVEEDGFEVETGADAGQAPDHAPQAASPGRARHASAGGEWRGGSRSLESQCARRAECGGARELNRSETCRTPSNQEQALQRAQRGFPIETGPTSPCSLVMPRAWSWAYSAS